MYSMFRNLRFKLTLTSTRSILNRTYPRYRYFHVSVWPQSSSRYITDNSLVSEEVVESKPQYKSDVDFRDYKTAYRSHSAWEITKSLLIFRLCTYSFIVDNSLKLMDVGRKILGRKLFNTGMKSSFYGQFVGGETLSDLKALVTKLQLAGIGPLLCVPIEEDVGDTSNTDLKYDRNLSIIKECICLSGETDPVYPMSQIKLTALVPAELCCRISELVPDPIAVPGKIDEVAKYLNGGDAVFEYLTDTDKSTMVKALNRLRTIGELGVSKGVRLVIDAEYTYLNPALRLLSLAMMLAYNRESPLVAYTYQNYLKITYNQLVADDLFIRSRDACFGVKLVRGAYMEKERRMAVEKRYPDPVHTHFENTSKMYHKSMDYLLEKAAADPQKYFLMVASHNENSVTRALKKMQELAIPSRSGSVFFGQIYGMCDYISYSLGSSGHNIYKSIPYGTVDDTLPYLHRRALENRSVLGGTQTERKLLWRALVNRASFGLVYK